MTHEILADYIDHRIGDREVVDWTRPDGKLYRDVPLVFIKRSDREAYLKQCPKMRDRLDPRRRFFWEVSVD